MRITATFYFYLALFIATTATSASALPGKNNQSLQANMKITHKTQDIRVELEVPGMLDLRGEDKEGPPIISLPKEARCLKTSGGTTLTEAPSTILAESYFCQVDMAISAIKAVVFEAYPQIGIIVTEYEGPKIKKIRTLTRRSPRLGGLA